VEKYVQRARHIEVQMFGDGDGTMVTFVERECSIQRRHQKIVEETPSPYVGKAFDLSLKENKTEIVFEKVLMVFFVC